MDIWAIQETKKGEGRTDYNQYILAYICVNKEERQWAGVGILIHKMFKGSIKHFCDISKGIWKSWRSNENYILYLSIYTLEECKPRDIREEFYNQPQTTFNEIPNEELSRASLMYK